jgi:hypothetical protein
MSRICSRHFSTEDILVHEKRVRLRSGAIPSRNIPVVTSGIDLEPVVTCPPVQEIPVMQVCGKMELNNSGKCSKL